MSTKITMDISHELMIYPRSPKTLLVRVWAQRLGEMGSSHPRSIVSMPAELLGMDLDGFLSHPWTAYLIQEAKDDLETRIEAKRKELAA